MTHLIQVVPGKGVRLFECMVKKEAELAGRGAFFRTGAKQRDRATWSHVTYKGRVMLERSAGEVVTVEMKSLGGAGDQWQLLHAFVGFLDRLFGKSITAINIQFRD